MNLGALGSPWRVSLCVLLPFQIGLACLTLIGAYSHRKYALPYLRCPWWTLPLALFLGALWLITAAKWGAERERMVSSLPPEYREEPHVRIRHWCWGVLGVNLVLVLITMALIPRIQIAPYLDCGRYHFLFLLPGEIDRFQWIGS